MSMSMSTIQDSESLLLLGIKHNQVTDTSLILRVFKNTYFVAETKTHVIDMYMRMDLDSDLDKKSDMDLDLVLDPDPDPDFRRL